MAARKKTTLTPKSLQVLLALLLVVVVAAGAGAFYLGLQIVKTEASEVNHSSEDARASAKQIEELQLLRSQLSEGSSLVSKANGLFADPATYQAQVYTDLRTYADRAGIAIESTDFANAEQGNRHSATIRLKNPVSYVGLIRFLDSIERSIPKLQVTSIDLSHSTNNPGGNVTAGDIKIEVMTR